MINKKAQVFGLMITIAVLIVCGYATFKFITAKTGVADMFNSPAKLLELRQEREKFEFFAIEGAKLAVEEAYQEIADAGSFAGQGCVVESGYINFCSLDSSIDEKFSSAIAQRINKFISAYPNADFNRINYKVSVKDKIIFFDSEKKQIEKSAGGLFAYSFTYDFLPSFSLPLADLNLNSFLEIFSKANECRDRENIAACMDKTQFSAAVKKSDGKTLFDLTSKKGFFIGGSSRNIGIKFSI